MRVLFWGTPEFALPSLHALLGEGHDVVGAVTQPDRPSGRGRKLRSSPVKKVALEERIPVMAPEKPRGEAFLDVLRALRPEISVVVAYGHLLIPDVLELPQHGSLNLHASLLPELRGAAPINWALVRGHTRTGVTVIQMTAGMDEGPILLQREIPINGEDTAGSLSDRLSELGAESLVEVLALLEVGDLEPVDQDHSRATYAPKVDRDLARLDWSLTAQGLANHVRGMDPSPGAWTLFDAEPLKLFRPEVRPGVDGRGPAPGTVLQAASDVGLVIQAGDGPLGFAEAQPAGRRRMEVSDWLRGGGPVPGSVLG